MGFWSALGLDVLWKTFLPPLCYGCRGGFFTGLAPVSPSSLFKVLAGDCYRGSLRGEFWWDCFICKDDISEVTLTALCLPGATGDLDLDSSFK